MKKNEKAIGTPVFTWQSHIADLVALIQRMDDTKELTAVAEALDGAEYVAKGRRQALRAMAGKSAYGSD